MHHDVEPPESLGHLRECGRDGRNPDNAPGAWMRPLLEEYASGPADAGPRTVRIDAHHVGYVEPIRMKSLGVACHGESLDTALREKLAKLYPKDEATGFREGDSRGLFWVRLRDGNAS